MIKLKFSKGTEREILEKIRVIDNLRSEIEEKAKEGVEFSNDAIIALSYFPKSEIKTFFCFYKNNIKKAVCPNEALNKNYATSGYSDAFLEIDNSISYVIYDKELELINWTDANQVPNFVTEVFEKLDCMPDEFINE